MLERGIGANCGLKGSVGVRLAVAVLLTEDIGFESLDHKNYVGSH